MNQKIDDQDTSYAISLPHEKDEDWPRYHEDSLFNQAVVSAASDLHVPYEMAVQNALAALSVACQGHVLVERPLSDIKTPVSLYLLCIAESGARKTTIENAFFAPIRKFEEECIHQYDKDQIQYKRQFEIWQKKHRSLMKVLEKQTISQVDTEEIEKRIEESQEGEPVPPKSPQFLFEDASRAALLKELATGINAAALVSSEGDATINGLAFQDNSYLNSLWSGSTSKSNRVSSDNVVVTNSRLTINLQVQPSSIEAFMAKRGKKAQGSGLLARFLTSKPQPNFGSRMHKPYRNSEHLNCFNKRTTSLLKESMSFLKSGRSDYTIITFSADAEIAWSKCFDAIEKENANGMRLANAREFASKLMENASRIAALLVMCEGKEQTIDKQTLVFALNLCLHYADLYRSEFVPLPDYIARAEKVFNKLMQKFESRPKQTSAMSVKKSEIYRTGIANTEDELEQILYLLERWGFVVRRQNDITFYGDNDYNSRRFSNVVRSAGSLKELYTLIEKENWSQSDSGPV